MLLPIYMRILLEYYYVVFFILYLDLIVCTYIHIYRVGTHLLFMLILDDVTQSIPEYSF